MGTKFLDHGLYAAYSLTPTFGTCQDGDGTAQGAASVATAAIDLTGYTAAAGATVTIGGALLTCVASGAGANQFNAGSGATLAANIATAINQTSNTNVIATTGPSNPMLGWPTNTRLQDMVYATSSGAVLNIQTRMGSAAFNGTSFFAVASSGLTGGTLNAQFTGGAGGAWGYAFNHLATFGKANIGIGGYGCWAATKPFAGIIDLGDRVRIRSNKVLQLPAGQSGGVTFSAMGSAAQPVVFEIDDGSTWPADGTNQIFKIAGNWNGINNTFTFAGLSSTFCHIKGKRLSAAGRTLVMETSATAASIAGFVITIGNAPMTWDNLLMDATGDSTTGSTAINRLQLGSGVNAQIRTRMVGCRQVWARENNSAGGFLISGINGSAVYSLENHEFVVTDCKGPINPILSPTSGGQPIIGKYTDCKFIGFVNTSKLIAAGAQAGGEIVMRNCDFGGIKDRGPNISLIGSNIITAECILAESKYGTRDFFLDKRNGFCEWNAAKGYPTASARLLDGATPWVIYASPAVNAVMLSKVSPFELPSINKFNTLDTGDRTVTMNVAIESTLGWNLGDVSFMVSYTDSTGAMRYVDSFDPLGAAAMTPDTTSVWSLESNGMAFYNGQYFAKKQISIACPDIAKGCEISVYIRLHTAVANTTLGLLVDPEVKVN